MCEQAAEAALAEKHPEIRVGETLFAFKELSSRGRHRFDLIFGKRDKIRGGCRAARDFFSFHTLVATMLCIMIFTIILIAACMICEWSCVMLEFDKVSTISDGALGRGTLRGSSLRCGLFLHFVRIHSKVRGGHRRY